MLARSRGRSQTFALGPIPPPHHKPHPHNATGLSASLPTAQLSLARDVAAHIGIPLHEVATREGTSPEYVANKGMSCFHCKTHLYGALEAVAAAAAAMRVGGLGGQL